MSRSFKRTKFSAITTATTEKSNKQEANRKFRRIVKIAVKMGKEKLPQKREVSNIWHFDKDGKIYDKEMDGKDLRK